MSRLLSERIFDRIVLNPCLSESRTLAAYFTVKLTSCQLRSNRNWLRICRQQGEFFMLTNGSNHPCAKSPNASFYRETNARTQKRSFFHGKRWLSRTYHLPKEPWNNVKYDKPNTRNKDSSNLTELRSFLGLCNVSRRFKSIFARFAAPSHKKLRKDQSSTFQNLYEDKLQIMQLLKNALIPPIFLALPHSTGHFTFETDDCDLQLGFDFYESNLIRRSSLYVTGRDC